MHAFCNLEKWNSLPKNYQAILTNATANANTWMAARYDMQNPSALKRLVAGGTQLRPFTNEVLEACLKATNELWARDLGEESRLQEIHRRDAGLSLRPISVVAGRRIHLRQLHDPLAHARLISWCSIARAAGWVELFAKPIIFAKLQVVGWVGRKTIPITSVHLARRRWVREGFNHPASQALSLKS